MSETEVWQKRWESALMSNYGTPPVALVRGEGAVVWDADGREYLDATGGLWFCNVGHGRAELADAARAGSLYGAVGTSAQSGGDQYRGRVLSISAAYASIPPTTLNTFLKPCLK